MMSGLTIRRRDSSDDHFVRSLLCDHWGETRVVTRGNLIDAFALEGLIAAVNDVPVGLITLCVRGHQCELVTLDVMRRRHGIGSALLAAAIDEARQRGCRCVWLITTNDNLPAIELYRKFGFHLLAVHKGAVLESRKL